MAVVTFKQIVDAVISDRFAEGQRANAKNWVNHRLWWLWTLEQWRFKRATDDVTVTSGSQTVTSLPTDMGRVISLVNAEGAPLRPIEDYRDFYSLYYDTVSPSSGKPEAFTVVGSSILVGPQSDETSSAYKLLYHREFTELSADSDVPAIPTGAHFALVHGGAAEGLKLQNDPTWQSFEDDFQATIQILRSEYLVSIEGSGMEFGVDRRLQWG